MPKDKKLTYSIVHGRQRDQLESLGDVSTKISGLETPEMLINSVISTLNAKLMTIDIGNMNLNTDLIDFQYMRFNIKMVP